MYINTFKYTPKDVSCQLCTEYVKKLGCTALRCPWLAERIEAGVVGYREAVMETFPRDRRLSLRLNLLIKHYPGSLWSNEQHERRMQYQCAVQGYRRRRDIGHYGRLRKAYLEQYRPDLYTALVANEKLHEHCAEIDEAARSRIDLISASVISASLRSMKTSTPPPRRMPIPVSSFRCGT